MSAARLILFAGRPGTGKTTLARRLAKEIGAVYLRVDTIEDGLRRSHLDISDLMDAGYTVAQALAADALAAGQTVVADAVHGHQQGRDDWESVAARADAQLEWFHVVCSDTAKHKARIDLRAAEGHTHGADWSEISTRALVPTPADWIEVDTATDSIDASMTQIHAHLAVAG